MDEMLNISGIKCDHCDFKDETVEFKDYGLWLNKPCPKCGENLLTREDYDFCTMMYGMNNMFAELRGIPVFGEIEKQLSDMLAAEGITEKDLEYINIPYDEVKEAFDAANSLEQPVEKKKKTRRSK